MSSKNLIRPAFSFRTSPRFSIGVSVAGAAGSRCRNGRSIAAGPEVSNVWISTASDASADMKSCGWMFLKPPRSPSETLGVSRPFERFVSCSVIVADARSPPSGFAMSLESVTLASACEAVNETSNSCCGAVVVHSVWLILPLPSGSWSWALIEPPTSALPPTCTFVNPRLMSNGLAVKFACALAVVWRSGAEAASR